MKQPNSERPMTNTTEVFGVLEQRNPLSYVIRPQEAKFKRTIQSRAVPIVVVHGMTKQGKSSLVRNALEDIPYLSVSCVRNITTPQLLGSIATNAFEHSHEPFPHYFMPHSEIHSLQAVTLLKAAACPAVIVIDNFHYLSRTAQEEFATDLRALTEAGYTLVILGTWRAANYLEALNSDLAGGRILPIDIEPWDIKQLRRVLKKGSSALNLPITKRVEDTLVQRCEGSVSLLQTATRQLLLDRGIKSDKHRRTEFNPEHHIIDRVFTGIAKEHYENTLVSLRRLSQASRYQIAGAGEILWLLLGYLNATPAELKDGYNVKRLTSSISNEIETRTGYKVTFPDEIMRELVDGRLVDVQQELLQTPIIAFNVERTALVALDSFTLYCFRYHRGEIRHNLAFGIDKS